jgi:hypothetical protein
MIVEEEAPPPPGSPDSSVVVVDSGGPISPKRRKADRGEDVAFATVLREVGSNRLEAHASITGIRLQQLSPLLSIS